MKGVRDDHSTYSGPKTALRVADTELPESRSFRRCKDHHLRHMMVVILHLRVLVVIIWKWDDRLHRYYMTVCFENHREAMTVIFRGMAVIRNHDDD